jgi:hypothetical protein
VLTWRYDVTHAGQNTQETALTPANVASNAFGKLFSLSVDDHVFAQPLYVPNLKMSDGQVHNVLFVATENDSIYAFDADTKGSPIWQISLLTAAHGASAGATPKPQADVAPSQDIGPNIGITGTPAINSATNTMYVVANTKESGQYFSRLHAINIITGAEQSGSPMNITATATGTGDNCSGGTISFSPLWENQRPALNYYNGYVYFAYSAHGDICPWHGWLFAYNATTLQQTAAICLTPDDHGGSVWGSGAGMPIDTNVSGGRMFVVTGNGARSTPFQANSDYGESVVAFNIANGQLTPTDAWTAFNYLQLNTQDWDQGSGGLLMLSDQPGAHPHMLITAGKEGRITVLNRDSLGGLAPSGATSNTNALQDITVSSIQQGQGFWGTAAYWNGNVYVWAGGDIPQDNGISNVGMAFKLNNGVLGTTPSSETSFTSAYPGPTFSISSNGTQNGIVWAVKADQFNSGGPAVLYAFDPDDLTNILYESDTNASRDSGGRANKFSVPVVTNGKVYVAASGEVDIYGLLNTPPTTAAPVITPNGGTFSSPQSVTMSSTTNSSSIYYTLDGSQPTTASTQYSGAITVSTNTTINAIATASGYAQSSETSATFTFSNQTPAVTFSPAAGTYATAQTVTISDTDASAKIYYTTDGTTPSSSSNPYSTPIQVGMSETIKAVAIDPAMSNSNIGTAAYVIQNGANPSFSMSGNPVTVSEPGASATATVTITPSSGFTGTVSVTCTVSGGSGAVPTCSVTQPPAITGSQSVNATINVNTQSTTAPGNYSMSVKGTSGSQSAATSIAIVVNPPAQPPQFSMTATSITIGSAGANATSTINITPAGGFTGAVALTCAVTSSPSNSIDPPTCSVTQPPAITGATAVAATLTVSTTPSSAALRNPWSAFGSGSALAALFFVLVPRRRRAWLAILGLLLFVVVVAGVGGCANTSGQITQQNQGTTAGTYTVTVTGTSGSLKQSTAVQVTVK